MHLRDYVVIFFLIVPFGLSAALCCYAGPAESGIPAEQIVMHGVGIDSDQQRTVWKVSMIQFEPLWCRRAKRLSSLKLVA